MAIVWTEAFGSFTPSGTGWQNYDIYTNLSVPKGAIAAIQMVYAGPSAVQDIGVRTDGSSLSRYIRPSGYAYTTSGNSNIMMYVKVDSSTGLIETYAASTTGVTFYLVGYWEGTDFTEQWTSCMPADGTWGEVNLNSVASVPVGRVAVILLGNKEAIANTLGVRTNGSAEVRSIPIRASATSAVHRCLTFPVKTDGSGIVEIYSSDTANTSVYCIGYFDDKMDYVESAPVTGAVATASSWTASGNQWDLTAELDQDGRVCDIVCAHTRNGNYGYTVGVRIDTSGLNRYLASDRSDGTGYSPACYPTQTGTTGIIQTWCSNDNYDYIRYVGYYKDAVVIIPKSFGIILTA